MTALGCLTIPSVESLFLIFNMNFPWCNFTTFLWVHERSFLLPGREKRPVPSPSLPFLRNLSAVVKSSLNLLSWTNQMTSAAPHTSCIICAACFINSASCENCCLVVWLPLDCPGVLSLPLQLWYSSSRSQHDYLRSIVLPMGFLMLPGTSYIMLTYLNKKPGHIQMTPEERKWRFCIAVSGMKNKQVTSWLIWHMETTTHWGFGIRTLWNKTFRNKSSFCLTRNISPTFLSHIGDCSDGL